MAPKFLHSYGDQESGRTGSANVRPSAALLGQVRAQLCDDEVVVVLLRQARDADRADDARRRGCGSARRRRAPRTRAGRAARACRSPRRSRGTTRRRAARPGRSARPRGACGRASRRCRPMSPGSAVWNTRCGPSQIAIATGCPAAAAAARSRTAEHPRVVEREALELQLGLLGDESLQQLAHGRSSTLTARRSSMAAYASAASRERQLEVEDPARLDRAREHVGQQLLDVAAHGRDAAVDADVAVEERAHRQLGSAVRRADVADHAAGSRRSGSPGPSTPWCRRTRARGRRRCRAVSSCTAFTPTSPRSATRCVAPKSRASACRSGCRDIAMIVVAPSRCAAMIAQSPTAPSPTTATESPGWTPAETAAWWPVPITSESVSRPGTWSSRISVAHRHERAVGERHAHALALPAVGEPAEAVVAAPPAAVQARRRDAVAAVDARVVAHVERCDHEVAHLDDAARRRRPPRRRRRTRGRCGAARRWA